MIPKVFNPGQMKKEELKELRNLIVKTDAKTFDLSSDKYRLLNPAGGGASHKTHLGLHDLSALLLNTLVPISQQQYKGRGKIDIKQTYCFMPLSSSLDQAVFQNINMLAKTNRQNEDFYNTVIDIRSKLTRIKLAAEHDMAGAFVRVGNKGDMPQLKYTVLAPK
jgi:hypothetical protein